MTDTTDNQANASERSTVTNAPKKKLIEVSLPLEAINAAAVLNGRPVGALRVSEADPRERHHGISHHSLTAYGRIAAHPADIAVPIQFVK